MSEELGDALLKLRTDDSEFTRGVDRAEKGAEDLGKTFDRTSAKAEALGKDLANSGKAAAAAGTQYSQASAMVGRSSNAQRAGMQQLSMQLNDVATMYALGAKPMQIFASQGGQVIQAIQLMSASGKGFVGFLAGPWGLAITTATLVLTPLISSLFEADRAARTAEAGADALGDAQSVLGEIFELTSGKIKSQNQLLITNARLMAINLRKQALADEQSAQKTFRAAGRYGPTFSEAQTMGIPGLEPISGKTNSAAAQALALGVKQGTISPSEAMQFTVKLDFTGTGTTREEFQQAIVDQLSAQRSVEVADLIDSSLDSGTLDPALRRDGPSRRQRRKGKTAQEVEQRFNSQLSAEAQRALGAMRSLATNAEDEAEYQLRALELARLRSVSQIKADKYYSAAQKKRLIAQVEETASIERERIERDKQARLAREQSQLDEDQHRGAMDALRLQSQMADTQAERKRIALEMFDLEERYQRSLLEAVIASETASDAEKKRAQLALERLGQSEASRRGAVARGSETDVERYIRELNKTPAQINEAIQGIGIDGLQGLNDQLVQAVMNTKNLGDMFSAVADQIVADLLRIAIQQAIIKPLANALFGGGGSGGGGGFFGDIFGGLFGGGGASGGGGVSGGIGGIGDAFSGFFATGGLIPAGTFGIVGENGPEPVIGTSKGAHVLPNSALRQISAGGGTTVTVPVSIDATGADPAALQRVRDSVDRLREDLPGTIISTVQDAGDRRFIKTGGWQ